MFDHCAHVMKSLFFRMFEIVASIPLEKDLLLRVKDYDLISSDDVIGETLIDLENRFLTKHRGTCGLAKSYCTYVIVYMTHFECQIDSTLKC